MQSSPSIDSALEPGRIVQKSGAAAAFFLGPVTNDYNEDNCYYYAWKMADLGGPDFLTARLNPSNFDDALQR